MLLYYSIFYYIILYYIILYYIMLYYILSYYIMLCIYHIIYIYTYILCIIHLHGLQIYRFHVFVQWVFGNFGTPKSSNGEIIWVNMDMLLFFIWKRHDDEILGKKTNKHFKCMFQNLFQTFSQENQKTTITLFEWSPPTDILSAIWNSI